MKVVYRRAEEQMPAERKEIEDAKKEGIDFLFQTNMIKVLDKKIECVKTELIKKEGETRAYPVNIENSNFFIDVDFVILAVGSVAFKWRAKTSSYVSSSNLKAVESRFGSAE